MEDAVRHDILALSRKTHAMTEASTRLDPARKGDPGWAEQQRILLADLSLHLLQTSLRTGARATDDLRRNLFSILTLSDQLMPGHNLAAVADELYPT